ncbi:MAG: glycosyltransferase family A protein, partial [archaeon]
MHLPTFLSIGVPAYHEEASIKRALNSILENTLWKAMSSERKELVVCVNGCKNGKADATAKVVLELAKQHPEIKVLIEEKAGHIRAKNILAREMSKKADVSFFFDSDVILRRQTIERLYDALHTRKDIDLVGAKVMPAEAFASPTSRGAIAQKNVEDYHSNQHNSAWQHRVSGCGYAIRTPIIKSITLPEHPMIAEDSYLSRLIGPKRTLRIPTATVVYRCVRTFADIRRQRVRYKISDYNLSKLLPKEETQNKTSQTKRKTLREKL